MNDDLVTAFTMAPIAAGVAAGGEDRTVRIVIPINVGASGFSLRFSNRESSHSGTIDEAFASKCDQDGNLIGDSQPVIVRGKSRIVIPGGEVVSSEELKMQLAPGEFVAVSIYCRNRPTSSNSLGTHAFESAKRGNYASKDFPTEEMVDPLRMPAKQQGDMSIPYFRALDLHTKEHPVVISCLGDSITLQCHWYTPLLERLYREFPGQVVLLNSGISGNRLLLDTPPDVRLPGGHNIFGSAGRDRVEWDSLADHGVTHTLFALGINDLLHADPGGLPDSMPTVEAFVAGCRQIVEKARSVGVRVIGMGIYPARLAEVEKEQRLREFNQAIAHGVFDDFLEVESLLADRNGRGYKPGFAQPDELHLSAAGGEALANGITDERLSELFGLKRGTVS